MARKANAFLYCACMCCPCRAMEANPTDIEPYEIAHYVWTISTLCRKAALSPRLLNTTGKVLKVSDLRLICGGEHDIT